MTSVLLILLLCTSRSFGASKVSLGRDGMCAIDGKPFFPIGIWVYGLNPSVMADLHAHHFNTIVGSGISPKDLPLIEQEGMKCIPMASDEWINAARNSPALLAWYLTDEPEEHNITPAQVHAMYEQLKAKDADHPIGITHDMLVGPAKYKGSCDFTMTDVYPITKNRDWPLNAVGSYTENTRGVHGRNWTNFTFIQTFGGPDTDGGKWAQPRPDEVRFMAFNALVHRADGILYFSYWPRAPLTWASIIRLNEDIERIVPWLVSPGTEKLATSTSPAIELRARQLKNGWIIIATNGSTAACETTFQVNGLGKSQLRAATQNRVISTKDGSWRDHLAGYEAKVYLAGSEQ